MRPLPEARKPNPPTLQSPSASASGLVLRPTFTWAIVEGATSYSFQLTSDIDTTFTSPIASQDKILANSLTLPDEVEVRLRRLDPSLGLRLKCMAPIGRPRAGRHTRPGTHCRDA